MNKQQEKVLREQVRNLIRHVRKRRKIEEQQAKDSLKHLISLELKSMLSEKQVADTKPTPNKSTGINVLEELLKKIIPVIEPDYKSLTTSKEQRDSFRAHMVKYVVDTLTTVDTNNLAGEEEAAGLAEEIDIDIVDDDNDKFIDIRSDAERKAEEEETAAAEEKDSKLIQGMDETGMNMANVCFDKVETSIIDSFEVLSNAEDKELFYDYLIANLKLYFDKFEDEMDANLEEPTNQAYDMAVSDEENTELPSGTPEEEIDIQL